MLFNQHLKNLGPQSSEEQIAAAIDMAKSKRKSNKRLLSMLHYGDAIYFGRSKNATIRIRGYLLESFCHTGLPKIALPHILDELESSRNAYSVAAAAKALRGLKNPQSKLVKYLLTSIRNIRYNDDAISFETFYTSWPRENHTTAISEILGTIGWLRSRASSAVDKLNDLLADPYLPDDTRRQIRLTLCLIENDPLPADDCCSLMHDFLPPQKTRIQEKDLSVIVLEDQEEQKISFKECFSQLPTLLVFFYTRCDNTRRCSLTITKLGQLQAYFENQGIVPPFKIAAITYDPLYDIPFRMKPFCTSRGMKLHDRASCFRVTSGMNTLLNYLQPGVNYNEAIPNHHSVEIFYIDQTGKLLKKIPVIEWDLQKIAAEFSGVTMKRSHLSLKDGLKSFSAILFSTILAFFPKCPFCAAAYLSMFGISTIDFFRIKAWVLPSFIGLLLLNLFALFWMGRKRKWHLPFYLSLAGAVGILLSLLAGEKSSVTYVGISLVIIGSLLNGLPASLQMKARSFFSNIANGFYLQKNHFSNHKPFKL